MEADDWRVLGDFCFVCFIRGSPLSTSMMVAKRYIYGGVFFVGIDPHHDGGFSFEFCCLKPTTRGWAICKISLAAMGHS